MAEQHGRMRLEGFDELRKQLTLDQYRLAREAAIEATAAGGAIVAKEYKKLAPKESGFLKRAIGVIRKAYHRKRRFIAIVKPRKEVGGTFEGKYRRPVKYAHLAEKGHIDAKTKRFIPGGLALKRAAAATAARAQAEMAAVFARKFAGGAASQ